MRASIDIGTNSVLLLVAGISDQTLKVIHEEQAIPRLGKGVDKSGNLHADSMLRVISVLLSYKELLEKKYPLAASQVTVTATSAVRDASNRDEFINEVKEQTGWDVLLLSGADEARTTFRGALSVLQTDPTEEYAILDIGGGSTEIAVGKGLKYRSGVSKDMGSVRFTERFFSNDPPTEDEIKQAVLAIRQELSSTDKPPDKCTVVGVAGTVTSIAAIVMGMNQYHTNELNGARLQLRDLEGILAEFSRTSSYDLELKYPVFLKGRGEVILAGALILREFLKWCGAEECIVSTGGIRHGILIGHSGLK